MCHLLAGKNLALICLRQTRRNEEGTFLVSRHLINKDAVSLFDIGTVFPLFLYDETMKFDLGAAHSENPRLNFTPDFLKTLSAALKVPQKGGHGLPDGSTPEDIFNYAYAVFHSLSYRRRYVEFLKIDFPRLPLPGEMDLFQKLSRLGGELVVLHLMESPKLAHPNATYNGPKNPEVERVGWSNNTIWLDAATKKKGRAATQGTMGFRGVPEEVWNFHIGGYQVCEKWLKDRKGRKLSADDITHYHRIVVALSETIRLMSEIDETIEAHGGWPDAFVR